MFINLRDARSMGVTPDAYLRREWAGSNPDGKKKSVTGAGVLQKST
jgi:uncharacterized protein affecting Mg2+/Co2+ transport